MSRARHILTNTFVQFFGRIITAILAAVSVKIITSYLGVEGYGAYTTVYGFVGLFAIIGDFGLYTIGVREMAKAPENIQKIYSNVLTMRVILTTIVLTGVGIAGMLVPEYQDTNIPLGIWICTIAVWFNLFYSIVSFVLQHKLKMHLAVYALVAGKILGTLALLYPVFFIKDLNLGFFIMVGTGIIAHASMSVITCLQVKKYVQIKLAFDLEYWKYLIRRSLPYGLAIMLSTVYFNIGLIMLSVMRTQTEVGHYGVPMRMVEVLNVLPLFFMNSVLGTLIEAKNKSQEALQKIFDLSLQFLLIMAVPIFLGVYMLSSEAIILVSSRHFLFSGEGAGSDHILVLLIIAMTISFFSLFSSFVLVAFDRQKYVLIVNFLGAFINIAVNLFAIPQFGNLGVAYTMILSEIVVVLVSWGFLRSFQKFTLPIIPMVKIIISGLAAYVFVEIFLHFITLNFISKILSVSVLLVTTYLGGLFLFGVIRKEMLTSLLKKSTSTP